MHAGFEGWGYVAGWDRDVQWVDFTIDLAKPVIYSLELRYAAGAGDASRFIFVNDAPLAENQLFASTGAWDAYATVAVTAQLHAGRNIVSVIYNASKGSHGFLNFDRLRVAPEGG